MTFNDIFKSGFLENVTAVSLFDMALALVLAFGLGMFIFLVYRERWRVHCERNGHCLRRKHDGGGF